jgi:predicted enzyme related to lactoylglutathione lyase
MIALADVAVTVNDSKASASWWTEKLGFAVYTLDGPGGHAVLVAPPGERFVIHLCEGFEPVEPGNTGIAFMSDDIEAMVRRMEAAGVMFTEPLRKTEWGGSAKFADPDGNVFWLVGAPSAFIRRETRRKASRPRAGAKKVKRATPPRPVVAVADAAASQPPPEPSNRWPLATRSLQRWLRPRRLRRTGPNTSRDRVPTQSSGQRLIIGRIASGHGSSSGDDR